MVLHSSAKDVDLRKSIKKYFLDTLFSTALKNVYFEMLYDVPVVNNVKLTEWIMFRFLDKGIGTVSEQHIEVDLFTRNDVEGDDLSALLDTFLTYLYDENSTNGLVGIPYYNTSSTPWVVTGGITPFVINIGEQIEGKDSTKIRTVHLLLKWGSK